MFDYGLGWWFNLKVWILIRFVWVVKKIFRLS